MGVINIFVIISLPDMQTFAVEGADKEMGEARGPAQSHTASTWQDWDQNQGPLTPCGVTQEGSPRGVCREGKYVRGEQHGIGKIG